VAPWPRRKICLPSTRRKNEKCRNPGGGPAGAFAAEQLASAGLRVVGSTRNWRGRSHAAATTYKAYSQYPFLIENSTPKRLVHETY